MTTKGDTITFYKNLKGVNTKQGEELFSYSPKDISRKKEVKERKGTFRLNIMGKYPDIDICCGLWNLFI